MRVASAASLPEPTSCTPESLAHLTTMAATELRCGFLGLGVVNGGAVEWLRRNAADIERRLGARRVVPVIAAVRDVAKARARFADLAVLEDGLAVATHPDVDVVVEAMGGEEPALTWVLAVSPGGAYPS